MASMTFLQLAQRLREKIGGAGTGPSSTIAQTGESLRQVNWVQEAWNEIQSRSRMWKWMRKDFSFQTAVGKGYYLATATTGETLVGDLADWYDDTFRAYRTSSGRADEQFLVHWDYDTFRDVYDFGAQGSIQERPICWTERPSDKAVLLGSTPDAIYTVTGQYQAAPSDLSGDSAVPGMPSRWHMLIVYRAMMLAGTYDAAPEVFAEGQASYNRMLEMLEIDQIEPISFGEPLA
jgi:hypothetical protein